MMKWQVFLLKNSENSHLALSSVQVFGGVSCGFPSPADDYLDKCLDLNEFLVKRPSATFMVRAQGDSMVNAGILPKDLLIIDRSVTPKSGDIVLAILNGEFTIKRYQARGKNILLVPENSSYRPIEVTEEMDFEIWGVVVHAIHSFAR